MRPATPLWPQKDEIRLPIVEPLPLIAPEDKYFTRVRKLFFKRPEYIIREDYFTYITSLGAWMWCPANFVYDFASVPKLIPFVNPAGVFAYPALPHDFIYRFGGLYLSYNIAERYRFIEFDRSEGDAIFLAMAEEANGLGVLDSLSTGILKLVGGCNYKPRDITQVNWEDEVRATK